jgi:hypothetical protein
VAGSKFGTYRVVRSKHPKQVYASARPASLTASADTAQRITSGTSDTTACVVIHQMAARIAQRSMQASTKLQKVRNPVDFMRTLQKSMSHAMRLKTLLPYESVVAFAYALRERCSRPSYMGRPHRLTRRTIQLYRRPASMDGESSARKSG